MVDRLEVISAFLKKTLKEAIEERDLPKDAQLDPRLKKATEEFAVFLEDEYQLFTKSQKYDELMDSAIEPP